MKQTNKQKTDRDLVMMKSTLFMIAGIGICNHFFNEFVTYYTKRTDDKMIYQYLLKFSV